MPQGNAPVLYSTEPQESPHFLPTNVAVDPVFLALAISLRNWLPQILKLVLSFLLTFPMIVVRLLIFE